MRLLLSQMLIVIIVIITYNNQHVPYHLHVLCFIILVPVLLRRNPFTSHVAVGRVGCFRCPWLLLTLLLTLYIYTYKFTSKCHSQTARSSVQR